LDRNGFKRSESGFDRNKTNPFLSISIQFRLLGFEYAKIDTQAIKILQFSANLRGVRVFKSVCQSLSFRYCASIFRIISYPLSTQNAFNKQTKDSVT